MARAEIEPSAWWLLAEEACGFCLMLHAATTEVRCMGCDQALCTSCLVVLEADDLCPHCFSEREG